MVAWHQSGCDPTSVSYCNEGFASRTEPLGIVAPGPAYRELRSVRHSPCSDTHEFHLFHRFMGTLKGRCFLHAVESLVFHQQWQQRRCRTNTSLVVLYTASVLFQGELAK